MSKPLGKPDRIVVALGGNALGNNPVEQIEAVSNTAHALLGLIEQGNEIIITHGNGPQVGMIQNAFAAAHDAIGTPEMPLPECGACLLYTSSRPRGQARAGRRQVGGGVHALAAPGLRHRHEDVYKRQARYRLPNRPWRFDHHGTRAHAEPFHAGVAL